MIKVITNSLGCGDWVRVVDHTGRLHDGHRITPHDLVSILLSLGFDSQVVELTDDEMENL